MVALPKPRFSCDGSVDTASTNVVRRIGESFGLDAAGRNDRMTHERVTVVTEEVTGTRRESTW